MHERFSVHCKGIAPPRLSRRTHCQPAGNSGTSFAPAGPEGQNRQVTGQIRRMTSLGRIAIMVCLRKEREGNERQEDREPRCCRRGCIAQPQATASRHLTFKVGFHGYQRAAIGTLTTIRRFKSFCTEYLLKDLQKAHLKQA